MRYKSLSGFKNSIAQKKSKCIFYAVIDGRQAGPMNETELRNLIKSGFVSENTLIWMPQLVQWMPAQLVPMVNKLLLLAKKTEKAYTKLIVAKEVNQIKIDMINAIVSLGFKKNIATPMVEQVMESQPDITLENGIKEVLKLI